MKSLNDTSDEQIFDPRRRWSTREREALDSLLPVIHIELLKVALVLVRSEQPAHRLEASSLVHEVLVRLSRRHASHWRSRGEFFGWAAAILRRVLVEHVRAQREAIRSGDLLHAQGVDPDGSRAGLALMAVADALRRIERADVRHVPVIEQRFSVASRRRPEAEDTVRSSLWSPDPGT